jgi:orotate phosphoribosyltransferase
VSALSGDAIDPRRPIGADELGRDLVRAACLRGDFLLSAGRRSDYYFDKYLFETNPSIVRRLATLLAAEVPDDTDRIAGSEIGAVILGGAVCLELGLPLVIVKPDATQYGTGRRVEGELHPGERITLIDDVVTTGSHALRAAHTLADQLAQVNVILVVLDREEGGAANIADAGFRCRALYRKRDLDLG